MSWFFHTVVSIPTRTTRRLNSCSVFREKRSAAIRDNGSLKRRYAQTILFDLRAEPKSHSACRTEKYVTPGKTRVHLVVPIITFTLRFLREKKHDLPVSGSDTFGRRRKPSFSGIFRRFTAWQFTFRIDSSFVRPTTGRFENGRVSSRHGASADGTRTCARNRIRYTTLMTSPRYCGREPQALRFRNNHCAANSYVIAIVSEPVVNYYKRHFFKPEIREFLISIDRVVERFPRFR